MTCTHPEIYRCNDPEHTGHDSHCVICGEGITNECCKYCCKRVDVIGGHPLLVSSLKYCFICTNSSCECHKKHFDVGGAGAHVVSGLEFEDTIKICTGSNTGCNDKNCPTHKEKPTDFDELKTFVRPDGFAIADKTLKQEKPTEDWVEEFHTKFRWLYDATYRHKDVIRDFDYEKLLEHIRTLITTREKAAREEGERDSIAWGFSKGKKVGREVLKKELLEKIGECRWKNVPINRPYGYLYDEAIADAVDIIKSLK